MEEWDVVVVGAGPAGATAARIAAAEGARTLLLDRAVFPRYKTCGGGLIGVSARHVPAGVLERTVESRIDSIVFTRRSRATVRVRGPEPMLLLVRREPFDAALADEAVAAGARFRDGVAVRSLAEDPGDGAVTLTTSAGRIRARVVVGADGSGGRVGRYVGVRMAGVDLGLEDELPAEPDEAAARTVRLDWGRGPGSYAWVFPKAASLTVGVIERRGRADATRRYLAAWRADRGLADAEPARSSGHLTQWREAGSPLARGRVLVAGEAAGLLEPWTREGISYALRSGAWAGRAAAAAAGGGRPEAAIAGYEERVRRELGREQEVGALLLAAFERWPWAVHTALRRSRRARRFFVDFCRGEAGLTDLTRHRALLALLRVAARPGARPSARASVSDGASPNAER